MRSGFATFVRGLSPMFVVGAVTWTVSAQTAPPTSTPPDRSASGAAPAATSSAVEPGRAKGLVRLSPDDEVWIDAEKKRVVVGGQICLREGLLEMFACPRGSKEHESVVSVNAKAYLVHTGLLAIGALPGQPVRYEPQYAPASGTTIQIEVLWKDAEGKTQKRNAKEMIRHVKTRQPMEHDWVFAGSGFWKDEQAGQQYYLAEGGELICVSNFSNALLDLPVQSSAENADLLFEAWTDRIPPLNTPVRLVLTPR